MHEVGVDILVIGRIAVQILMRVYLKDLKARVGHNNVKAEVFKRRYVAAQLGDDAQHLVPVRKRALDFLLRVGMDGAWGYDVLPDDLGVMEKARFFIYIGENAAGADIVGKAGALCSYAFSITGSSPLRFMTIMRTVQATSLYILRSSLCMTMYSEML